MKLTKPIHVSKYRCKCNIKKIAYLHLRTYNIQILSQNIDTTGKQFQYILKCIKCRTCWKYYTNISNPIQDIKILMVL